MHSAHVSFRCPFCCFHCISSCLVHDMRIVSSWNAPISSRIMHFNWKRQRDDVGTEKKKESLIHGGWRCQRWAARAMTCPVRCVMYLSFFCRYQFFILSLFSKSSTVSNDDATRQTMVPTFPRGWVAYFPDRQLFLIAGHEFQLCRFSVWRPSPKFPFMFRSLIAGG